MPYLIVVSFIWAFSFGLIRTWLVGVDSGFIAAVRLGLALLVFLPFFRWRGLVSCTALELIGIGAIQFGIMYLAYNEGFKHLQAHEVALLTLTTPVFVTLFADALDRTFRPVALGAALLAIIGTAVLVFTGRELRPTLTGLALVQTSNVAFAIGQVAYKRFRARHTALRDRDIFALPYLGGFLIALASTLTHDISVDLRTPQLLVLLYLGILASGVGFFLWNLGATRVQAGTLAVMNNAKIPLAVAIALLFFGERADLLRLSISLLLLGTAVWISERRSSHA